MCGGCEEGEAGCYWRGPEATEGAGWLPLVATRRQLLGSWQPLGSWLGTRTARVTGILPRSHFPQVWVGQRSQDQALRGGVDHAVLVPSLAPAPLGLPAGPSLPVMPLADAHSC